MRDTKLIDEVFTWPACGPGEAAWNSWLQRARAEVDDRATYQPLINVVKQERSDGLSLCEWEVFLAQAMQLHLEAHQ